MNIFYIHSNPKICAEMHVDRHVCKMVIEYAQLLSTAHRVIDGVEYYGKTANNRNIKRWKLPDERENDLMLASHINHPSAVWCRQSKENYMWLYTLWKELLSEFTYRYGKIHACARLLDTLKNPPSNISNLPFTEPTPAMPDDCKVPGDSLTSYRRYYVINKTHLWSWSGKINSRERPQWLTDFLRQAKESAYATV
jgi:hypothetical protein